MPAYRLSASDIDTLARTLYGEARGEGLLGMRAIAHVIMNRLAKPGWWSREKNDGIPDDTVAAVCRDPWQFSCWNSNDPNLAKLRAVTLTDPLFQQAMLVVLSMAQGQPPFKNDPTGGATHYHAVGILPKWAKGKTPSATIGRHIFYTNIQ